MSKSELLEMFAEIATSVQEEGSHKYWDITDPDNIRSALDFWESGHLGFLGGRDRQELLTVWQHACDDPRETKMFLDAISVLKEKYGVVPIEV